MIYPLLMQILQSVIALIVAFFLTSMIQKAFRVREDSSWLPPTFVVMAGNFLRWAIWVAAALLILEIFGLPLRAIWAGILSTALIIAVAFFASWSLLSNILSSMILIAFSRMRVGDIVELRDVKRDESGIRGRVVDINLFFVSIEEVQQESAADQSPAPAVTQIPCHMFMYRATRCWPGHRTKPLSQAMREESPELRKQPPHHGGV